MTNLRPVYPDEVRNMATLKLGKFKIGVSKSGIAFRAGDGEVKRFPFGLDFGHGASEADEEFERYDQDGAAYDQGDAQDYQDYDDAPSSADAYADDYAYDEGDYGDQGYDDQGYDDQGYDDQGYDDQGYDDQGYDDQGYDDQGYDDQGYDDRGYDDQGVEYDDEGGYYDEDGQYVQPDDQQSVAGSFMQYIDENDWVTYVLLVLFAPLGIYLLWRRGRFDMLIRAGISVASALWFVALIWIIVSLIPNAGDDPYVQPGSTSSLITPSPAP